jgi:formylglycine-generating enzyme required for sulfatase activity
LLLGIAVAAVAAIAIVGYLGYRALRAQALYGAAVARLNTEQWEKARSELTQLASLDNNYRDAATLLRESYYRPAVTSLNEGRWQDARSELAQLASVDSNYRDVATLLRESYYRPAVASLNEGRWQDARSDFAQLASVDSDYKDTATLLRESYYRPAVAALSAGEWETAKADLEWLASNAQDYASKAVLEAGPVTVPAGEFVMGSTDADGMARSDEKPQHKVYLDAFLIDRTEVTNAMYAKCVDAANCHGSLPTLSAEPENYPVTGVAWSDAQAYCAWAGGRLPTEAEWEKAARGTDGRIYPWGNEPADAQRGNYNRMMGGTTPVGAYPQGASPYGALDMTGNVWEWVADWYGDAYYASSPGRNPTGPSSGDDRVLRGGSCFDTEDDARAAARKGNYPLVGYAHYGFRCVHSP